MMRWFELCYLSLNIVIGTILEYVWGVEDSM